MNDIPLIFLFSGLTCLLLESFLFSKQACWFGEYNFNLTQHFTYFGQKFLTLLYFYRDWGKLLKALRMNTT